MSLRTALYDEPDWYDLLHDGSSAEEFGLVYDLFRLHGNGGKDVLEPACGTGRLLARFRKKGFRCTGYDLNPRQLSFARKERKGISFLRGDMRTFRRKSSFDLAYNLLATIRHLMSEKDALAHLRCVADSLKPGGIYVVQLDLSDYDHQDDDEEDWSARSGKRRVDQVMMSLTPDRARRREKIIHFLTLRDGKGPRLLKSEYDLRSYDLAEWRSLIGASPLRIASQSLFPAEGPGVRDGVFVLKPR